MDTTHTNPSWMRRTIAVGAVAALLGGGVGGVVDAFAIQGDSDAASASGVAPAPTPAVSSQPAGTGLTAEQIYKMDSPGVVVVTDTQTQQLPATPFRGSTTQQVHVLGSGFVIDRNGDIVTNEHVVQGATQVRVGFTGGATYPATVIGADASTDLAVVRVSAPSAALHPLTFGASGSVQVGDSVYAIGNPFGLDRTMTAGIVSATGRSIQAPNGLTIDNAIQSDAAINHGNSGGPLLNRFGQVIGVNSQILTGGTSQGNVGVGFAVPSSTAQSVVNQLLANGHASHPFLGLEVETIDPTLAAAVKGLPKHGALVVRVVPGGPAAKAGLVAGHRQIAVNGQTAVVGGDAIVSVDGKPIASASALTNAVAAHRPGDTIHLGIVRAGQAMAVAVTLGNAPGAG